MEERGGFVAESKRAKGAPTHFPEEGVEPDFTLVESAFERLVRSKGLKLTSQRRRILKKVFSTHEHFTAEDLHEMFRRSRSQISRATIYRTLGLLVEGGFLDALDLGGDRKFYEHVLGHERHDHIICLDCGKIMEFQEPRIDELQGEIAEKHGFRLEQHTLKMFARCRRDDCPDRPKEDSRRR